MKRVTLFLILAALLSVLTGCRTAMLRRSLAKTHIRKEIVFNGLTRYYLVYKPERAGSLQGQIPVLFALHGGGGVPENMVWLTGERFNRLADRYGFIVVYPQGFDKGWNDGRAGDHSTASAGNFDDVGFIKKIISDLNAEYNIDLKRIFTCGISNGGFMSSRLACEASGSFRGAAIVTATMGKEISEDCLPGKKVDILIINGTADPLVPYNGGEVKVLGNTRGKIVATDDYAKEWAARNGCTGAPDLSQLPDNDPYDGTLSELIKWSDGGNAGKVSLIRVKGGGHTWPGGKQYLGEKLIGKTSRDFNACDMIIDFFGLNK